MGRPLPDLGVARPRARHGRAGYGQSLSVAVKVILPLAES
jgi:hypothetical protein